MQTFKALLCLMFLLSGCCVKAKKGEQISIEQASSRNLKDRFIHYSKVFMGSKYLTNPFGKKQYNLKEMNCITYVQNILALSISKDFNQFEKNIAATSYNKATDFHPFLNRYHFTTDYINHNSKYFENVTEDIINKDSLASRKITISYQNFFNKFNQVSNLENKTTQLTYLDIKHYHKNEEKIKQSLQKEQMYLILMVPNEETIEETKKKIKSAVDVHHLGFLFLKDGKIYLRHSGINFDKTELAKLSNKKSEEALRIYGKIVKDIEKHANVHEVNFNHYLEYSMKLGGVMFFKIKDEEL